jgi:drug/metabolite transporter (DMT)-like permease
MEIVLAIAAAFAYGISDFGGGVLTKRMHVLVVFFLSQVVGLVVLLGAIAVVRDALSWPGVAWGAAAGVAGVVGTSLLYQGLAIGRMSVVAPITGVLGAGVPVAFGLATGDQPGALALAGMALGLVAVVVITRTPDQEPIQTSRQAVWCAVGAGLGFGTFYVLLQRSPADSGLWPMLGTRVSLVVLLVAVLLVLRLPPRPERGMVTRLVALGLVNLAADMLFLFATRQGLLSIVAVLTSLYPAVTIGLAAIVLRERVARVQLVGLLAAGVAVVLIALS